MGGKPPYERIYLAKSRFIFGVHQILIKMDAKEYFEKVMQDYNQHRNGRSLRKYCTDEAIDYDWLIKFKKTYPVIPPKHQGVDGLSKAFIPYRQSIWHMPKGVIIY